MAGYLPPPPNGSDTNSFEYQDWLYKNGQKTGGGGGGSIVSISAGTNITITGTSANPVINATGGGGGGSVTGVTASGPLASSGGTAPNISLTGLVPINRGGTGTATPALSGSSYIAVTGSFPNQTIATTVPITKFTSQTAAPTGAINGDRWFDTSSGIEYTWISSSSVWAQI